MSAYNIFLAVERNEMVKLCCAAYFFSFFLSCAAEKEIRDSLMRQGMQK